MGADTKPTDLDSWMRWVERELRVRRSSSSGSDVALTLAMLPPEQVIDGGTGAPTAFTPPPSGDPTVPLSPTPFTSAYSGPVLTPSTPTATARLGVVEVCWDGLANDESVMPYGLDVQVHRSQEQGFEPTDETFAGTVRAGACLPITGQAYNSVWYYRLVSVNRLGVRSAPSAEVSATTTPLVDTDIIGQVLSGANFMDGTIDTAALADGSVSASKIAAGAVQESHLGFTIESGGVTVTFGPTPHASPAVDDLWYDSTNGNRLNRWDGTQWVVVQYGSEAIGADAITSFHVAANAITSTEILDDSITTPKIAAGAVTAAEIAALTITAAQIAANTITAAKIAANTITAAQIAANTITAAQIAASTITAAQIAANTLTADVIAAGAIGADELAANSVIAGKIAANAVTASTIAALAVTAGKIAANAVTADTIAAGAVAASKISTGELAAGVRIIAGPETAAHAEMTDAGFFAYVQDSDSGLVRETVRMGTVDNDVIALSNSIGDVIASISEEGLGSFNGGSIAPTSEDAVGRPYGFEIYGTDFTDWDRTHGMVLTAGSSTNANASGLTSRLGFREISFFAETGRSYTVHLEFPQVNCSTLGALGAVTLRGTTDGTSPTINSPIYASAVVQMHQTDDTRYVTPPPIAIHGSFGSDQLVRLLACFEPYAPSNGSWSVNTFSGNNVLQRHLRMWVLDEGWVQENTMITNTGGGGVTPVKTYVATWKATNSAAYTSTGGAHFYSPQLVQGYYSSQNGDSYGYAVFGGTAISGNDGAKTIATALSGATLQKAEAYLYANHWYYNSGGTAFLRPYNSTSLTNAVPAGTVTTSANWPKPGGRWVTLSGATTAIRGFSVGKANSTNLLYYGRFNAYNASSGYPLLRLTYTR